MTLQQRPSPRSAPAAALLLALAGCGGTTLFTEHSEIPYDTRVPVSVAVADLDGDGDLDVVTADRGQPGDEAVSVHWNGGDGILAPPVHFRLDTTEALQDLAVADLTADGALDLVVLLDRGGLVLANAGGGVFRVRAEDARVASCDACAAVVPGDFDGDGQVDLFTVSATTSDLWPGPACTERAFPAPPHLAPAPAPRAAHLDAGGTRDLVGLRPRDAGGAPLGLLGQDTGVLLDADAPPSDRSLEGLVVAAADLTGDGLDDLLAAGPGWVGTWPSEDGAFGALRSADVSGLEPVSLSAFDATGDGRPEVFVGDRAGRVHVLVGGPDLSFLVDRNLETHPGPTHLAHGDLDGDGFEDLVVAAEGTCCPRTGAGLRIFRGGRLEEDRPSLTLTP